MKHFFASMLMVLSASAFSTVKIQEEVFVIGQKPEILKELILSGSVVIDHVSSQGFELYGDNGLKSYLDLKKIPYFDMKDMNKAAFADFPTYDDMVKRLQNVAAKYPQFVKLFSIGKSIRGRELWMVKISDNVGSDEIEPEFKYISSMHGDEITGRELTLALIEEMTSLYGSDAEITELINNTEIFIMPSMNPDGSELHQRANAKGVDINRNFPEAVDNDPNTVDGRTVETQLMMRFQASRKFSLSANFHGGTIVANYPWDSKYELHPLDALVKEFSLGYAELNPEMRSSGEFEGGVTNGAQWYVVKGGMQDWSYNWHNDLQITVELSHSKWPKYDAIAGFYKSNRDSMVWYMKQVHHGAGFKISRSNVEGVVSIKQVSPTKEMGSYAFSGSEFYKILPTGNYIYNITERNGATQTLNVKVESDKVRGNGNYLTLK